MKVRIAMAVLMGLAVTAVAARAQCPVLTIGPADPTLVAIAGELLQVTFTASGGTAPYTFSSNPQGVPANGIVSFPAPDAQSITLVVSVTDAAGCTGQKSYSFSAIAPAPPPQSPPPTGLPIGQIHTVFVIVMENRNWADIKGSTAAPYINHSLLPLASHAEQYFNPPGVHPSLPNYLWLEGGSNFAIGDDNVPYADHQSTTHHLVTLLQNAGLSWRSYQEDIPGDACPLVGFGRYVPSHNPMVYFDDVTNANDPASASCIKHVRPYAELQTDLVTGSVANYNFITPNVCDDMQSSCAGDSVVAGDAWLSREVPKILASQAYQSGGALFITWDEGTGGDGPIGLIALSPLAKGNGYTNSIHYTHSSMLRTIETLFGVAPLLGDASNATDLGDLFGMPVSTPGPSTTDDHDPNPLDYGVAMDIPTESILSASFPARHLFSATTASRWGAIQPQRGPSMVALSTGNASVEGMPGFTDPQPGTDFGAQTANPFPTAVTCRDSIGPDVIPDGAAFDLTELGFTLRVPETASGISFDFNFLTSEFPESVCTTFGDRFLALLESRAYRGNLAIDTAGQPMSASTSWLTVTDPGGLAGTGMEHFDVAGRPEGAATGWRRVAAPVVPGEQIRLRFVVFDTGDGLNDSQALIDNFAWCAAPSIGSAAVDRSSVWPPNGDLIDVGINYDIEGGCGPVTSTLTVTANERLAAGDILVVDGHHVRLRAARLGSGSGRIYTVTISAADGAGHVSRSNVAVTVPHDRRR